MLVAFYRRHWQALCAVWALTLVLFLYLPSGVKPVDSTSVSQESVRLPVVMYHGVQKGTKHVGPYVEMCIRDSPSVTAHLSVVEPASIPRKASPA